MHVKLSYCDIGVFKHLCGTYMSLGNHELMAPICELFKDPGVQITPAQAAGIMDANKGNPAGALSAVRAHLEASRSAPDSSHLS